MSEKEIEKEFMEIFNSLHSCEEFAILTAYISVGSEKGWEMSTIFNEIRKALKSLNAKNNEIER